jgi:hypothetical protein
VKRDPLDNLGPDQTGLQQLLTNLTSAPTTAELSGERAAAAMFQAVRSAQSMSIGFEPEPAGAKTPVEDSGRSSASPAGTGRTGSRRAGVRISAWLAAGATALALAGGFAVAGYAAALPAPLQRVAHRVFGFVGVPNSPAHLHPVSPEPTKTPTTSKPPAGHRSQSQPASRPPHSTSQSPSPRPSSKRSASPSPKPSSPTPKSSSPSSSPPTGAGQKLAITASAQQITAGGSVQLAAVLAEHGQPSAHVSLTLLERIPGGSGWRQAGHASTDGQGKASFAVADLVTNAAFRITGPDGVISSRVVVVVTPPVSASLEPTGRHRFDRLVIDAPLAQRGNLIVLEVLTKAGEWRAVRTRRLHQTGQTGFTVVVRKVSVSYQAVLLATRKHGQSVSNEVTVPGRANGTSG